MSRIGFAVVVVFLAGCHHASDSPSVLGDLAGAPRDSDMASSDLAGDMPGSSPDLSCPNVTTDAYNCGSCGNACTAPEHAIARCADGMCAFDCGAGYYLSSGACVACAPGTSSAIGATACAACPAGSYAGADAASCTACAAGTYGPMTGTASCTGCAAGTFASTKGSTICTTCAACEAVLTACTASADAVCCPNGMTGLGSAASPCLVTTCKDLQDIAQGLSLHYRIDNDIDCSATSGWNSGAGFSPITSFSGELDGSSLAIDALFENTTGNAGLFGDASGTLHDIELTHVSITGGKYTGGLVGKSSATITSCSVSGTVAAPSDVNAVGGLVGYASGSISGCSASGAVSGYDRVGGLVGDWEPAIGVELTGSTSSMQVAGGAYDAGGLVAHSNGPVSGCSASGAVTGDGTSSNSLVGGLIGYHLAGAITSCSASGTVYGGRFVGGLVGADSGGPLTLSFATGDVTSTTSIDGYTGGLVGYQIALAIDQCYATGNVRGSPTNGALTGGLVGLANGGAISNSYARGNVTSSDGEFAGGLVGEAYGNMGFSNSYATGAVSIVAGSAGGVGGLMSSVAFTGPCFATGAVTASASSACGVACDGSSLDGSYWYEAPGTAATGCGGSNNTTCTAVPQSTGLSYFYTVANAPMSSWSFGAGNPWSSICNGVSFPVLTFQGLTSASQCP